MLHRNFMLCFTNFFVFFNLEIKYISGGRQCKPLRGPKESTPTPSLPSQIGNSPSPATSPTNQDKPMSPKEAESAVQVTEPDTSSPSLTTGKLGEPDSSSPSFTTGTLGKPDSSSPSLTSGK